MFRTRYGYFEYLVLLFGLSNTPAIFQAYINSIFVNLLDITVIIYLDDILIFSKNPIKYQKYIKEVLLRLKQNGLYAKLSKYKFFILEVEFLGFVINTKGIAIEKSRLESI
jgi:hypothetical protein